MGTEKLRIGHDLSLRSGTRLGAVLTEGRPRAQGLSERLSVASLRYFLVGPDKTLWFSAVQNMAFARPRFSDLIDGFEFLFARGYFKDQGMSGAGRDTESAACSASMSAPQATPGSGLILYDSVCIFCSRWTQFVIARDPAGLFRFVPVQSDKGRALCERLGINADNPDTFAVVLDDKPFVKSAGVLAVVERLPAGAGSAFSAWSAFPARLDL